MSQIEFVDGLICKPPRDKAPEFLKASISIKREELIAWLSSRTDEWINVDIKEARSGKYYAAVNSWKRDETAPARQAPSRPNGPAAAPADSGFEDDDIQF